MGTQVPLAVATHGLTKRFGRLVAVDALELAVEPGQVFGFLGLNGAGKTTTIRMLLDLLRPTAGRAEILGHDCQVDGLAARALMGYMPGEVGFYRDMTGRQVLGVLSKLSRGALREGWQRELLERLALRNADLDRRIREYSTGMKRKLAIVSAFQSDPTLLILDEPTEGLDPLMQEAFYELLAEVRKRGTTVFLSSHVLSEVDRVCDRIGLLRAGELVLTASVEQVRKMAPRLVRVVFRAPVAGPPSGWPSSIEIVEVAAAHWSLRVQGSIGPVVEALGGLPVADLEMREPRLEDVIINYYRGDDVIRETGALVRHSLRRFRTPLLVTAAALAGFQVLLGLAAQELQREGTFQQIINMIPAFVRELFGSLLVSMMSFSGIMALGYYHVAIVAVLVGLVVAIATEPAGEVETGFADLVLSRPVPRAAVMTRSVVLVFAGAALVVSAMAAGTFLGLRLAVPAGSGRPAASLVWKLAFSLWCLLVCWGGVSLAIGAARRRAVAASAGGSVAAALMLVDYLARFWKPIRGIARLSPFHYYSPLDLVMNKPLPPGDIGILLGTGVLGVAVAYALFLRRDL